MTTINSGNIINLPDVLVDPNSFLPPGVVGMRYVDPADREPEVTEDEDGSTVTVIYDEVFDLSELSPQAAAIELHPPITATIIEQSVHVANDGRFAVDVVLEVEDILGVRDYEVRVSKA